MIFGNQKRDHLGSRDSEEELGGGGELPQNLQRQQPVEEGLSKTESAGPHKQRIGGGKRGNWPSLGLATEKTRYMQTGKGGGGTTRPYILMIPSDREGKGKSR